MIREPPWGRNWYILPAMIALAAILAWFKSEPESEPTDIGGGITIRKLSDERSDKITIRQMSPD